jgi:adenylate cyclase
MISHFTNDLVKNDFETRQLDKITVVGKSEPVVVHELLAVKGELGEDMEKLLELYNQGQRYYYDRQWDKAIDLFGRCEPMEPNRLLTKGRTPSAIFVERSREYSVRPPEKEWNGVYKLQSK